MLTQGKRLSLVPVPSSQLDLQSATQSADTNYECSCSASHNYLGRISSMSERETRERIAPRAFSFVFASLATLASLFAIFYVLSIVVAPLVSSEENVLLAMLVAPVAGPLAIVFSLSLSLLLGRFVFEKCEAWLKRKAA